MRLKQRIDNYWRSRENSLGFSHRMKGQYLLPLCTQTGFSQEKPIELAEAQDVYAWVSHILLLFIIVLPLIMVSCTSASTQEQSEPPDEDSSASQIIEEVAPDGVAPPPHYDDQSWADIVAEARGQSVNWYMWSNDVINGWVEDYVADQMKARYDITVNMVQVTDAPVFVNKVRAEKEAGQDTDGEVDLMWINGENYRVMREENLLYGPWSEFLPNAIYVNWNDPSIANDFGHPVEGYESPYGKAQIVIAYDKAKVDPPPTTIEELIEWIKANPGKFTYPAMPDFTGSAFIRHICYWAADGYEPFLAEFDQDVFDQHLPACYQTLNDIEPFLWQDGKIYPESGAELRALLADGEVYFAIDYEISGASRRIEDEEYPDTIRTFVFETGTLANTNYVAIPYNSPHKAGAMVVANFLLSPEAQEDKWITWGSAPVLAPVLLSVEWREKFSNLPRGVATLPFGVLDERRLPEPQSAWVEKIEQGWIENVLNK